MQGGFLLGWEAGRDTEDLVEKREEKILNQHPRRPLTHSTRRLTGPRATLLAGRLSGGTWEGWLGIQREC